MGLHGITWWEVSLFYEGMSIVYQIDYLNNDRSHDWINLQTKIYTFLTKSPLFRILNIIQEYSWIFFEVQNPHLSLLEIRKGRKGVVKSSINLQKMIYNWPREGRGRGHCHIHGRISSKMGRKLNFMMT